MPPNTLTYADVPFLRRLRERTEFASAASRWLPVDFEDADAVATYRQARDWCRETCRGRWRPEPSLSMAGAKFLFENPHDAVEFALTFDGSTP